MIKPAPEDLGREVFYLSNFPGDSPQPGKISSFNDRFVFVRFGNSATAQACDPRDLYWDLVPRS